MSNYLPWLVPPRNKDEFNELESNMAALTEELYGKLQMVAAVTNHRLRHPKGGSKWAEKLAFLRIDIRAYARSVSKPIAKSGAAAIEMGKAFRLSHTRFYDAHSVSAPSANGNGAGGFDFH